MGNDNVIVIDLDNRDEYVNEYDDNKINMKLRDYIVDNFIDIKKDVLLKIKFHYQVKSNETEKIKSMLFNDFDNYLNDINDEVKKINFRNIIFGLLGMFFLIIYWYLENFHVFVISEFCLVISWVVFWEIIESMLFSRRQLIIKRKKCQKLLVAKIEFN